MVLSYVLLRLQIALQTDLFVLDADLLADVVTVGVDCAGGERVQFGDLLGCLVTLDKIGNPDFCGGQVEIL